MKGALINFCPISEFSKVIPKPLTITESPSTIVPNLSNNDSNSYKGKEKVEDTKVNTIGKKVTFVEIGMGEYKFENALCVGQLPLYLHSFRKLSPLPPSRNRDTMHVNKTTFEHWGSLSDEHM